MAHESFEASKGVERVIAFSDSIFAFAMTLLAVSIIVPQITDVTNEKLTNLILNLGSTVLGYLICYFSIGLYWFAHHRIFKYIEKADSTFVWINILLLLSISFTPFPASLIIQYDSFQTSWVLFASVMAATGIFIYLLWNYATSKHRLTNSDIDPKIVKFYKFRALIPPTVFFVSIAVSFLSVDIAKLIPFASFPIQFIGQHFYFRKQK